jgi:glycopeptide antibiotics resistance protein
MFRADTLSHTVMFLPWMFIGWLHLNAAQIYGKKRVRYALRLFCAGVILAAFAEGMQYFFLYRSFSFMDLSFSVAGVVLGCVVFFVKPKGRS